MGIRGEPGDIWVVCLLEQKKEEKAVVGCCTV